MKKIIMIGLPETGKTTFLAAFWHIIESANYHLQLEKLPPQSDYISSISEKWGNCEPLDRTVPGNEQKVDMTLKDSNTNEIFNIVLPDLSGETFEAHFKERQWDDEYEKLIVEFHGILLFVHPNKIETPTLIADVQPALSGLDVANPNQNYPPVQTVEWDSTLAPTQVKLVDILQFHIDRHYISPLKIAVIISAWDCITTKYKLPNEWLEERLPLLEQFLKANNDHIQYKIFGVSAQGGDLIVNKRSLLTKINPTDRIIVKDEKEVSNDLSSPILWLLGDLE